MGCPWCLVNVNIQIFHTKQYKHKHIKRDLAVLEWKCSFTNLRKKIAVLAWNVILRFKIDRRKILFYDFCEKFWFFFLLENVILQLKKNMILRLKRKMRFYSFGKKTYFFCFAWNHNFAVLAGNVIMFWWENMILQFWHENVVLWFWQKY